MNKRGYFFSLFILLLATIPVMSQGTINNRPGDMSGSNPGSSAPAVKLPSEQTYESVKSKAPSTILYGQSLSMGGTGSTPPGGGSIGSVPVGNIPLASFVFLSLCYLTIRTKQQKIKKTNRY